MDSLTLSIIELIVGILVNVFIGKLGMIIFRKDNTLTRIPLRFLGIFLVINSAPIIFHF